MVNSGIVAQASELLQCILRFGGQAVQLPHHEVHDVVGVTFGVNAIEVPAPSRLVIIESEQCFVGERRNELNSEKRIAGCLLVDQLCQRRDSLWFAAKRIRD